MPESESKPEPLYQDERLKVDHSPTFHEDHIVLIDEGKDEEYNFILPRGTLRDVALVERGKLEAALHFLPELAWVVKGECFVI